MKKVKCIEPIDRLVYGQSYEVLKTNGYDYILMGLEDTAAYVIDRFEDIAEPCPACGKVHEEDKYIEVLGTVGPIMPIYSNDSFIGVTGIAWPTKKI